MEKRYCWNYVFFKEDGNCGICLCNAIPGYFDGYGNFAKDCRSYTTSYEWAKRNGEEYGYITWMNSRYCNFDHQNPKWYFTCLLECLNRGLTTCGEIKFIKDAGIMIYETPDAKYRVYKDANGYVYLFERII